MRERRLTWARRCAGMKNAFSESVRKLGRNEPAVHFYNFCRIHKSLRVIPMAAGIAGRAWDVRETALPKRLRLIFAA